ncbi:hypothetical protein DSECCO2_568470 [anaerobic digester metagenome]
MGGRGASSQMQKNSLAVSSEKWRPNVEASENRIRGKKTETAILVGMDGKILIDKSDGHKSQVGFNGQELALMDGAILTHNHPRNSTFSDEDLKIMVHGLKEIRAVAVHGTFVMKKTRENADISMGKDYALAQKEHLNQTNKIWAEAQMKRLGLLEMDKLADQLNHSIEVFRRKWLAKNAKNYGFIYTYERRTA